ncbi:MAG TPA: hypothetical protein V6D48_20185, partial [Oculatellaceae cyanobacterium]
MGKTGEFKAKDSFRASSQPQPTWAQLKTRPWSDESADGQTSAPAAPQSAEQRKKIARAGFNLANIPLYAPEQTSASAAEPGGIQRQEVEEKNDNLQMKSQAETPEQEEVKKEDIQTKPQTETPQQEEVKKEDIQTK